MDRVSIIGVVYALSLRSLDEPLEASRFPTAPGATHSLLARLHRRSGEIQWRTRIAAAVGLLLAVVAAGLAVAVAIYWLGHVLNQMIQGFMGR